MVIHIADKHVPVGSIRSVTVEVDSVQVQGRTQYAVRVYLVDGTSVKYAAFSDRDEAGAARTELAADLTRRGAELRG